MKIKIDFKEKAETDLKISRFYKVDYRHARDSCVALVTYFSESEKKFVLSIFSERENNITVTYPNDSVKILEDITDKILVSFEVLEDVNLNLV